MMLIGRVSFDTAEGNENVYRKNKDKASLPRRKCFYFTFDKNAIYFLTKWKRYV